MLNEDKKLKVTEHMSFRFTETVQIESALANDNYQCV